MQRFGQENFGDSWQVVSGRIVFVGAITQKNNGGENSEFEGGLERNLVGNVVF